MCKRLATKENNLTGTEYLCEQKDEKNTKSKLLFRTDAEISSKEKKQNIDYGQSLNKCH